MVKKSTLEKIIFLALLAAVPLSFLASRKLEAGSTTRIRTLYNFQYNYKPAAVKRAYRKLWPSYLFTEFRNGTKEKGFFLTDDGYRIILKPSIFYIEPDPEPKDLYQPTRTIPSRNARIKNKFK